MCSSSPLFNRGFINEMHLEHHNNKSLAIPLPDSHIHRTDSELQLYEDMAVAEYRDRCMFNRLVSGIRQRQQLHYNFHHHAQHFYDQQQGHGNHNGHGDGHCGSQDYHHGGPIHHDLSNGNDIDDAVWPPSIQDTERSIENIISTRCKSVASTTANANHNRNHMNMNMTPNNTNDPNSNSVQAPVWETAKSRAPVSPVAGDNDWAIEGFDSPRPQPHKIGLDLEADSEHSDHVFDIEL